MPRDIAVESLSVVPLGGRPAVRLVDEDMGVDYVDCNRLRAEDDCFSDPLGGEMDVPQTEGLEAPDASQGFVPGVGRTEGGLQHHHQLVTRNHGNRPDSHAARSAGKHVQLVFAGASSFCEGL